MEKYGVFISHSHKDWLLAGRVSDFFELKKCRPFLDVKSMSGYFEKEIMDCIENTPYFVCVITRDTFKSKWVKKEIAYALKCKKEIILVSEENFRWPLFMGKNIREIKKLHVYEFNRLSFIEIMEKMYKQRIDDKVIDASLEWVDRLNRYNNTYVESREKLELGLVPKEDRFGSELIKCALDDAECSGINTIKIIHMCCYAANTIFTPENYMVDEKAYDRGKMSKIFRKLLSDDEFSMEIVINAPFSAAVEDAVKNKRIGNSSQDNMPEVVFLSSYFNMLEFVKNDPVYKKAYEDKRFRFMVTDKFLPYSIFHVQYKEPYKNQNHVKVDIYSENMISHMERRTMFFSEKYNKDNYNFFVNKYDYIRSRESSEKIIEANKHMWQQKWQEYIESGNLKNEN